METRELLYSNIADKFYTDSRRNVHPNFYYLQHSPCKICLSEVLVMESRRKSCAGANYWSRQEARDAEV